MLEIVPIFQSEAKAFIERNHRTHKPPIGSVFQVAVAKNSVIVGVAMVGRPVSRMLQDGWTLEVLRVCTDGTKNACSKLYGTCWRIAKEMGYKRLVTYTLDDEPGTSLRASGWKEIGRAGGLSWNTPSRPRVDKHPQQMKIRFERS